MFLLDKFENKYIIKGTLVAVAPLHIGTGNVDFSPTAVDNPVIRDENGNPFVPGTALKGVIRSLLERILATGAFEKFTSCNILEDKKAQANCINNNDLKKIKEKFKNIKNIEDRDEKIAKEIYERQCDVCKLFGGHGFASRIQFSDARLKENSKAYTSIRDGIAIDRDTLIAATGAKYTFESIAAGTEFDFEMTIDNLEKEYKKLIGIILTILKDGELKVGGKTSAGLGNIQLRDINICAIEDKEDLKKYYLYGNKKKLKEDYFNV